MQFIGHRPINCNLPCRDQHALVGLDGHGIDTVTQVGYGLVAVPAQSADAAVGSAEGDVVLLGILLYVLLSK